jgi:two-component system sensor histidine kinase AtoS
LGNHQALTRNTFETLPEDLFKIEDPPFIEKFNITVPREIDRINHLVEDLLELTRRRIRPFANLDVNLVIFQIIDLHGEEMKKKQVAVVEHLDRSLPIIPGDPERLYRAFSVDVSGYQDART